MKMKMRVAILTALTILVLTVTPVQALPSVVDNTDIYNELINNEPVIEYNSHFELDSTIILIGNSAFSYDALTFDNTARDLICNGDDIYYYMDGVTDGKYIELFSEDILDFPVEDIKYYYVENGMMKVKFIPNSSGIMPKKDCFEVVQTYYIGQEHFVMIKNHFNETYDLDIQEQAFDDYGQVLETTYAYCRAIGPKDIAIVKLKYNTPVQTINSYTIGLSMKESYYDSLTYNTSIETFYMNNDYRTLTLLATNHDTAIRYVQPYVLYLFDDQLISYDILDFDTIEKGESYAERFNIDVPYNRVEIYLTGVRCEHPDPTPTPTETPLHTPTPQTTIMPTHTLIEVDGGDLTPERQPNVIVDVGFGDREYDARTNEYGQLVEIYASEIILQDEDNEPVNAQGRYYNDEAAVAGTEQLDLDQGHVIADSLGGVANAYNITPQNSALNRYGDQAYMEKIIRDAGGCTNFLAIITYDNTETQIPSRYSYSFVINGERIDMCFPNVDPEDFNNSNNNSYISGVDGMTKSFIQICALDKKEEFIKIKNTGITTNLSGWKIVSVRGQQDFIFPDYILEPDAIVTVGDSARNIVDFHWLEGQGVWNNSKDDDAELYDANGNLVGIWND